MKKLNLCILALFLFSAFLFGVESDPSEIVGYVAYDCVTTATGSENFIALPMDTGYDMASELGNAYPGQIIAISNWVPATQSWSSAFFSGGTWFDDYALEPGNAYMISITEAITFYSVGPMVDPIIYNLVTGTTGNDNFIMVPLDRSDLDMASELGDDIGVVNAVSTWVAGTQSWSAAFFSGGTWFDDYGIEIARPLMVGITEAISWPSSRFETRY